jgi:ATP-binding cassette subfamily C protein
MKFLHATLHNLKQLNALIRDLFHFSPWRTLSTFFLILSKSITSGIGLLFILPLLQLIGFSFAKLEHHQIMNTVSHVFQWLHIEPSLITILLLFMSVICFTSLIAYAEQMTSTQLQQQYNQHLRTTLHRQILLAHWSFFLTHKKSDLLYQLTSQTQAASLCNHQLLNLINNIFLIMAYTGFALLLSWSMTLLAVGCALLLLTLMLPLHVRTSRAGWSFLQHNQRMHQCITEQFNALKMIKGSGFEATCIEQVILIGHDLETQNQQLNRVTAKSRLIYTCSSVILFSALLYAALAVLKLSIGALLLILVIFARILPMISNAQQMYQRILHQLPAYISLKQLLQTCRNAKEPKTEKPINIPFEHSIKLNQISFNYPTQPERVILDKLSIQLKKNTTTLIYGPSGTGKSTLADLIVGLLEPTHGNILIDDTPMTPARRIAWRKNIAYITQDVFLFNASIRENLLLFSPSQSEHALKDALTLAAADFVLHLEHGLDSLIGDNGVRLSGGERQRIALARALLMKPQLLILDESTNALDQENLRKIQHTLTQLRGEMTILIISHQQDMQTFADQNIILQ